jgi:hypothetical protein
MAPTDESVAAGGPPPTADFAAKAAARVESVVGALRDRSVRPVFKGVNYGIFAFAAFALLIVVMVLVPIALVRLFDVLVFGGRVWASDTLVGGTFALSGLFLLSRRRGRSGGAGR